VVGIPTKQTAPERDVIPRSGVIPNGYDEVMTQSELQPHQIDQKLAPKIKHPAPRVFYVARGGLLKNALMNVVRNLIAQIVLHFRLNLLFVERVDGGGIHTVSSQKFAVTLIKLPE
jgi:hypothetical protein